MWETQSHETFFYLFWEERKEKRFPPLLLCFAQPAKIHLRKLALGQINPFILKDFLRDHSLRLKVSFSAFAVRGRLYLWKQGNCLPQLHSLVACQTEMKRGKQRATGQIQQGGFTQLPILIETK